MKPGLGRWITSLAGVFAGAAAYAATTDATLIERVRYIGTATYSRVVVDLSGPIEYRVTPVEPEGKGGPPDRLVIDVSGAKIGPEAREPLVVGDSLLRRIRTGQFTLETARIVLDLATDAEARAFTLPDPYRLVIDLKSKANFRRSGDQQIRRLDSARIDAPSEQPSERSIERSLEPPASVSSTAARGRSARAKRGEEAPPAPVPAPERRLKVVLDPGHGGKDPGAQGVRGLEEKDVTLAIAALVAERLATDAGIEVALTRTDDRYLSLEERTGFANAQGADLFVSIHANASTNPATSGVEVYYLNNTNNRGTLRLAAMENNLRWDPNNPKLQSAIPDLSYILSDLRQTYKVEESKQLAENLQQTVVSRLGDRYDDIDDLGVKEGPFYVLVGAYMPCVLVEVSFLTHPIDGARLATDQYRATLADGIYEGIHRYISQTKLAKTL